MKYKNPRDASKPTDPKLLAQMLKDYDDGKTLARSVDLSNQTKKTGPDKVLMLIVESYMKSPRSADTSE